MFCKNCGKQIPDGAAHCPECGAAQAAAPQQAAPVQQNAAPQQAAPVQQAAPKAPININADFNKSVNVGGKKIEFTLFNIIPVAMMILILIAMVGIHSFTFMTIRQKGESKKNADKFTYDMVIDNADDSKVFDNGFTSFMKFLEVFTEIVAVAGIAGCLIFMNKDNIMAMRSLSVSAFGMFLGFFFMFIYALYLKGEYNDLSKSITFKGGPTFTIILWTLISLAVAVGGFLLPMVLGGNKTSKTNTAAPATPAGGFGGFNA